MSEIHIVAGVRTAVGTYGGSLKDIPPTALAAQVVREAMARSKADPATVGHVVFGQVVQSEPRDVYMARVAAIEGGLPEEVPALTVNRLCGSGLQAVLTAAQAIQAGDADVAVAGGAESMSRAPYQLPSNRWGARFGDGTVIDTLKGALTDPFHRIQMGLTAENVAERYGISRDEQDAYAVQSHQRAARAIAEGRFDGQILPIRIRKGREQVHFAVDEHVRPNATTADLARLATVFKEGGSVTAGNASGMNDGAAAVVLASAEAVRAQGLTSLGRLVAWGYAGVDPAYMGIGPIPATRRALDRAGLTVADLGVIESNEAFASQACAVARDLGLDPELTNPNGSGISIGHPVGATGAINLVKCLYELRRTGRRYGLVTMCIGGGQGIAAIVESAG